MLAATNATLNRLLATAQQGEFSECSFSIDGYFNCATKNEFVATFTFSIDGYAETGCCVLPWNAISVGHESDMRSGKMVNFQCNCGASILIHGAKNLLFLGFDWANPKFLSGGEAFGAYSCSTVGNPNPTTPECGDLASAPSTLASSTFTAKGSTGDIGACIPGLSVTATYNAVGAPTCTPETVPGACGNPSSGWASEGYFSPSDGSILAGTQTHYSGDETKT